MHWSIYFNLNYTETDFDCTQRHVFNLFTRCDEQRYLKLYTYVPTLWENDKINKVIIYKISIISLDIKPVNLNFPKLKNCAEWYQYFFLYFLHQDKKKLTRSLSENCLTLKTYLNNM